MPRKKFCSYLYKKDKAMKPLTIKKLIEFRGKSERAKKTFAQNLKIDREQVDSEGGGNYWAICLSAIGKAYKTNDNQWITDKIDEFEEKLQAEDNERTQDMYQRNLRILRCFENLDFDSIRPSKNFKTLKQNRVQQIVSINGLPIKVTPKYVFVFGDTAAPNIGIIWFVAQLGGFKQEELAMYADAAYRYLYDCHSKTHTIDPRFCVAMDVSDGTTVNYSQLQAGDIPRVLNSTIKDVTKLVNN